MKNVLRPFHLAFPIFDIEKTIDWYTKNLLCTVGRRDVGWVDLNFFGHQISAHLISEKHLRSESNPVDGHQVSVRHFGIILEQENWQKLSNNLQRNGVEFIIKPYLRFKGKIGEQSTMFIKDPTGNVLEFKSFKDDTMIFNN